MFEMRRYCCTRAAVRALVLGVTAFVLSGCLAIHSNVDIIGSPDAMPIAGTYVYQNGSKEEIYTFKNLDGNVFQYLGPRRDKEQVLHDLDEWLENIRKDIDKDPKYDAALKDEASKIASQLLLRWRHEVDEGQHLQKIGTFKVRRLDNSWFVAQIESVNSDDGMGLIFDYQPRKHDIIVGKFERKDIVLYNIKSCLTDVSDSVAKGFGITFGIEPSIVPPEAIALEALDEQAAKKGLIDKEKLEESRHELVRDERQITGVASISNFMSFFSWCIDKNNPSVSRLTRKD